jgi:hypothetical protein
MKKEIIKRNVGIDMAKDDFKVCFSVMTSDLRVVVKGSRTFSNNEKGFVDFLSWAEQKSERGPVRHFTMEATGIYYEGPAYYLYEDAAFGFKTCPVESVSEEWEYEHGMQYPLIEKSPVSGNSRAMVRVKNTGTCRIRPANQRQEDGRNTLLYQ